MHRWISGNQFTLLENGDAFFPRVFDCISTAQREVIVETFIWFDDLVGRQLQAALIQASQRGVQVDVTIDDYGSPDLSPTFLKALTDAGVRVHVFDPGPRLWGWRTNLFRRLHRKIVVVDGDRAFVGGINYSADHVISYGPTAKQDYTVELTGPIVRVVHTFVQRALESGQRNSAYTRLSGLRERVSQRAQSIAKTWRRDGLPPADPHDSKADGGGAALFVTRDNGKHTSDIEHHYRVAIRAARHRIIIANAYFFPGYRLLTELRKAARRGVDVRLILQGEPDMPIVKIAAGMLYHHLLNAGVRVHEYCERPLHGKVAVFDDQLATVGSSNLDPLSLSLNLEANVFIKDSNFNRELGERLTHLMRHSCKEIGMADLAESSRWRVIRSFFIFHLLRRYPAWGGWLPAHTPRLRPVQLASEISAQSDAGSQGELSDAAASPAGRDTLSHSRTG